jgi:ABC-type transport system substrate-binding protein
MTLIPSSASGGWARRTVSVFTIGALLAGCGSSVPTQVSSSPSASSAPPSATAAPSGTATPVGHGGTLRVVVPASGDITGGLAEPGPAFLDPHLLDWPSFSGVWELWRCCLGRNLMSHNGLSMENGGSRVQPDLASAPPEVSADGLTWTFHLKEGIRYAPPLQAVEITAPDFIRAFDRVFSPKLDWDLAVFNDFTEIQGALEYQAGKASSISGLQAPDDHTLVIRLTRPEGDLGARLAEPAAAPIAPDPAHPGAAFGIAEGADTGFGRFAVSSGPYMLEGSATLDFSVPAAERTAPSGLQPGRIVLVRNPSWDATSDPLRPAYADRIEIWLVDSVDQAVSALTAGDADLIWPAGGINPSVPAAVYDAFQTDPSRGQVHVDLGGAIRPITMNVALPPFDDVHVRRAVSYAIDKQHLVDLQGGAVAAEPYGHIVGDALLDGLLRDYDPYATPGHAGDLEKARAELAQATTYDTNGDGRCDAAACAHVPVITREEFADLAKAVAADLEPLGIQLDVKVVDVKVIFYELTGWEKYALQIGTGCHAIYVGAGNCLMGWFDGATATALGYAPSSLVGATPEQLKANGYEVTQVPNVDARIEACIGDSDQFGCWAKVDQYLMEQVVPWVPYAQDRYVAITSPRVVTYAFNPLTGGPSLDRLALKP